MKLRRMMVKLASIAIPIALLSGLCPGQAQTEVSADHLSKSKNLAELLRFVSQQYHLPLIAEILQPLPSNLRIPEGTQSAEKALTTILDQTSGYRFDLVEGKVVHFYNVAILSSPNNVLNQKLTRFTMPPDVSELKILLPARLDAASQGLQGEGAVTSGFGIPELEDEKLKVTELKNISGREVLLKAAEQSQGFFSIIVFPNRTLRSKASKSYVYQHWIWGALTPQKHQPPIYIQNPPQEPEEK